MPKPPQNEKPHHFALTLLLGMALFLGNSTQVLGVDNVAPSPAGSNNPIAAQHTDPKTDNTCVPAMTKSSNDFMKDYRDFLEKNFSNKSNTASLLKVAIQKYQELQHNLYQTYSSYYPNPGSLTVNVGVEPSGCLAVVQNTLADARFLLKKHALQTSTVKKSAALLEKYQEINGQLSELHQKLIYLKSGLDVFSNKLPCYIKSSCMK